MDTYKILRFKRNGVQKPRVIAKGLTLEQAQAHCSRPDTQKKDRNGNVVWFDGYEKE